MGDMVHGSYGTCEIWYMGDICTLEILYMGDMEQRDMVHGDIVHGRYVTWKISYMRDMIHAIYGTWAIW